MISFRSDAGSLGESEENRLASKGDRTVLEPQESTYVVGSSRDRCDYLCGFARCSKSSNQTRGCRASDCSSRLDGTHPCVFASVSGGHLTTGLGQCAMPELNRERVDRFEADLRYGAFVLRQSDLLLNDVFEVPLTRAYNSQEWDDVRAFGLKSNHPYDIAPTGSRWPYTYITLNLEDSDFLYFKRISEGTGYADAVFMHTETSTPFYKATIGWNGDGWTLRRTDGSEMHFPEAYNAKSRAQGAAFDFVDPAGNKLQLNRDRQRTLKEIRTPHGRWIHFEHD